MPCRKSEQQQISLFKSLSREMQVHEAHEVLSSWNMKYVSEATQIPEEA